ncbi:MAG TPA: hypothetical protein VK459_09410, partial [Polyangiaceae bacterium]|nr:hypothetical protein [Polyangiaceae bacterium]
MLIPGTSTRALAGTGLSLLLLASCGSSEQAGRSYPPPPLACFDDLRGEPLPPIASAAACSEGEGAPEGPAMVVA